MCRRIRHALHPLAVMQLSERGNEAKTPNKAVKTDGAASHRAPFPSRPAIHMRLFPRLSDVCRLAQPNRHGWPTSIHTGRRFRFPKCRICGRSSSNAACHPVGGARNTWMAEIDVRASERRFRGGKNDLTSTVHYHRVAAAGTQLPASVRGLWSPFKNGGGGVGDGVCNVGSRGGTRDAS